MQRDAEGFAYPHIDADRCTECGLCQSVCPASGDWRALHETSRQPTLYAAWHLDDEVRRQSSSGGVFTALARAMLDEGGVVYGAGFDDTLQLRHVGVTGEKGLTALRGSKYLQSDTGTSFRQAQSHLDAGRPVLYSGTPCQIAGLYAFLGGAPAGLVTVDLVCHGVPSALFFERYLADARRQAGGQITRAEFRDKRQGWRRFSLTLQTASGVEHSQPLDRDPFLVGFLRNLCLRPSCHACPYACVQRVADITLGDFWGIRRCHPELDDDRGVSEVLINTPQGQQLFEACRDQLFTRECRLEDGMQGSLRTPSAAAPERAAFFGDLERLSFDELRAKYLRPRGKHFLRRMAGQLKRSLRSYLQRGVRP
jgi:coenzyme F420-reducing hydrogenase beta subunit